MVTNTMPKTGLTSEEIRGKALEIARKTIRRNGLDKFRLIDVARELGVTHAALYNHFPGKEAVLDAISEGWLARMDEALAALAAVDEDEGRSDADSRQDILRWFLAYHRLKLNKVRQDPELYKSFNLAVEAQKPFVQRHMENIFAQLTALVERAVAEGELRQGASERAVKLLFEGTKSFHHPVLVLENKEQDREELLKEVVTTLLAGLSVSG